MIAFYDHLISDLDAVTPAEGARVVGEEEPGADPLETVELWNLDTEASAHVKGRVVEAGALALGRCATAVRQVVPRAWAAQDYTLSQKVPFIRIVVK